MRVNFDGTASVFVGLRRESTDGPEQTPEVVRRSITIDHSVRIRVPIRLTAVTLRDLRLLSGDPIALRAASAELWIEALISLTYDRFDADNPVLLSLIDIYPKVNVPGTRSTCP